MNNLVATKDHKALISIILNMGLLLILIAVCLFRLFTTELQIMIIVLLIGLIIVGLFFFIKELINLINYLKTPVDIIKKQDDYIIIYNKTKISVTDLISIEKGANNTKVLFYQADIILTTKTTKYTISNIANIDDVFEQLNQIITKKEVN